METSQIASQIKKFLKDKFPYEDAELTDATNLLDEWFVDSLGIVETVQFIETNFDIRLARADVNGANFENITALSNMVAERLVK